MSTEQSDGYWYCVSGRVYPRFNGEPAPESNCAPTEPVVVHENGTASGLVTGVARPAPVARDLPSTGVEIAVVVAAAAIVSTVGAALRRIARA